MFSTGMGKGKKIVVFTYWPFQDPLIQTYTLPYLKVIKEISPDSQLWLITLEPTIPSNVENPMLSQIGIQWKPLKYYPFGLKAMVQWLLQIFRLWNWIRVEKIEFIHCWCTPAGAIGYILSVFTNAKLIIDSYEPHAEAMVENGTWRKYGLAFQLLFGLERLQSRKAAHIISATQGMKQYAKQKYNIELKNFSVKPACVDLQLFSLTKRKNKELLEQHQFNDKIVCVYAGKFGGIYLKEEVFEFLRAASAYWQEKFRVLLLTGHTADEIEALCTKANVDFSIVTVKRVPHHEVPLYLGLADFALTPVKPVPSKRYCTPIKDGEYWAMGLPVVIPCGISDDSEIIEENNIGVVLKSLDHTSYQEAVKKMDTLLSGKEIVTQRARAVALKYRNISDYRAIYQKIYATE